MTKILEEEHQETIQTGGFIAFKGEYHLLNLSFRGDCREELFLVWLNLIWDSIKE